MTLISSRQLIDLARIAAIVACVGLLYSPSVATIGLIVCYVAFLASGNEAVSRFKAVLARPMGQWGMVFLGIVVVGMAYASVPWHDRWTDFYKWRTILWCVVTLALFDEMRWKERFLAIFLLGTMVAVVGSFAAAAGWVTLWRGPNELLRNNGTQGMAFACSALVCFWAILEKKPLGGIAWIWPVLGGLYVANVVFVTDSRSGYVVLGLGSGILLSWRASWKHRMLIIAGLVLTAVVALSVSPRMHDKMTKAITEWTHESEMQDQTSFGLRRVFYVNTLEILSQHWLLGLGTGGFPQAYREHVAGKYPPSDWRAVATGDPHNQYLAIVVQQGIGGLFVFLVWLMAIGLDRGGAPVCRGLAVAILAGWCVTSLFSSHFRTFAEGHLLATFLGVLLAVDSDSIGAKPVAAPSQEA